jgi:NAD(P)-dependent dehydrogenase (short-subunit alcohol dehydrogenase family)
VQKVALITGASSGIGLHLAQHLLTQHSAMRVIAVGRQMTKLENLARMHAGRMILVNTDISTEVGRAKLLTEIAGIDKIDLVVHSAAIVTPLKQLTEISYADWQGAQQTNLDAPLFLTLKLLDKLSQSRVMFLTSDVELRPVVGAASYCISKMALHMAWACLQAEIPAYKAVFGLVAPGNVDTPMQAQIRQADPNQLPIAPVMKTLYEQGKFLSADYVADFLTWLLLKVEPDQYADKIWDIYEEISADRWSSGSANQSGA